ncbi:MAG: hypothetical protein ACLP36_12855 [Acidimicrobiales bacterium]
MVGIASAAVRWGDNAIGTGLIEPSALCPPDLGSFLPVVAARH